MVTDHEIGQVEGSEAVENELDEDLADVENGVVEKEVADEENVVVEEMAQENGEVQEEMAEENGVVQEEMAEEENGHGVVEEGVDEEYSSPMDEENGMVIEEADEEYGSAVEVNEENDVVEEEDSEGDVIALEYDDQEYFEVLDEVNMSVEELSSEFEEDRLGADDEELDSEFEEDRLGADDEVTEESDQLSFSDLQNELLECEYEVAQLQYDKHILESGRHVMEQKIASLQSTVFKLNGCVQNLIRINARLRKFVFQASMLHNDNKKTLYYTGLPSYALFYSLFEILAPYAKNECTQSCSLLNQFLLILSKLRLGLANRDLAYRLNITEPDVSTILHNWMDLMYRELRQLIIWPDRQTLRENLPECFKGYYSNTVCIIDCFEVFLERSVGFQPRSGTYSNYKKHNTIKVLIGITPTGSISFVSKAWGGRASDKIITQKSGFLDMISYGDLILADRGFNIHDELAVNGARLGIPAFTKGKQQLSGREVEETRRLANVRIHVERVIGQLKKKYKILQGRLQITLIKCPSDEGKDLATIDKIITIACALTNLCKSVVENTEKEC